MTSLSMYDAVITMTKGEALVGRIKKNATIEREYIDWLLELASTPSTQEIRDSVSLDEVFDTKQELESIIDDITDPQLQRRFRSALRNALDAHEKLGFCVGHLLHERGI